MTELVRLAVLLLAVALVTVGVVLIYPPAGWIFAGLCLAALAFYYDLEGSSRETRPPGP